VRLLRIFLELAFYGAARECFITLLRGLAAGFSCIAGSKPFAFQANSFERGS